MKRTIVTDILEEVEKLEEAKELFRGYTEKGSSYLVVYSLPKGSAHFYKSLDRIRLALRDGDLPRYGFIICEKFKTVRAILMLLDHFNGDHHIFSGTRILEAQEEEEAEA